MAYFPEPDLLPGIFDDITLAHIVTKLPWTTFHALASLNRTWQRALQSREVYAARVLYGAVETLVVVKHRHLNCDKPIISLYSMREKKFYRLPPPPPHLGAISRFSQLLTSNGTLYVTGAGCQCRCSKCCCTSQLENQAPNEGALSRRCTSFKNSDRIYMLDLAGKGQWVECPTKVIRSPVHGVECHPTFIRSPGDGHTDPINCVSELENGYYKRSGRLSWFLSDWLQRDPLKTLEWKRPSGSVALALDKIAQKSFSTQEGKNYLIRARRYRGSNYFDIYYEDDTKGEPLLQHSIINEIQPRVGTLSYPIKVEPLYVLPLNNELVAIARWTDVLGEGYCMIQSAGFGSGTRDIVWEKAPHSRMSFLNRHTTFAMCPIQL